MNRHPETKTWAVKPLSRKDRPGHYRNLMPHYITKTGERVGHAIDRGVLIRGPEQASPTSFVYTPADHIYKSTFVQIDPIFQTTMYAGQTMEAGTVSFSNPVSGRFSVVGVVDCGGLSVSDVNFYEKVSETEPYENPKTTPVVKLLTRGCNHASPTSIQKSTIRYVVARLDFLATPWAEVCQKFHAVEMLYLRKT